MSGINLLPWREENREERKKEFLAMLGASVAVTLVVLLFVHLFLVNEIHKQQEINQYLKREITVLNVRLKAIRVLHQQRSMILSRMKIIETLQTSRPMVVQLFDGLVRILPNGVYVTSMERKGQQVTLFGRAESNTVVSKLMRNIESSSWFENPVLTEIKRMHELQPQAQKGGEASLKPQENDFELQMQQQLTKLTNETQATKGKKSS